LVQTARKLFERVPILGSLCVEVLVSQCVSSLISFLFVLKVKEYIPNDQERARWTGTVYAWINASSGVLQFAVLPFLVKRTDARKLWLLMPSLMVACATLMSFQSTISLHLVAAVFSVYKALEYSVRGVTVEMVYTPLDYQSRFVGKEIIGLCVSRFGISGMAIGLSVVTTVLGSSPILDQVFVQALSVSSLLWLVASLPLANGKVKSRIRNNRKSTQKEERKEDDCC
jgi:ATP/ADP translocase